MRGPLLFGGFAAGCAALIILLVYGTNHLDDWRGTAAILAIVPVCFLMGFCIVGFIHEDDEF